MTILLHGGEPTLFDLTYMVASRLGVVSEGTATGGSTTTVVDTALLTQADDYWNGGTVWVLQDVLGTNAAPEGEYGRVSDFDQGTNTATIAAVSAAIASGDRFAIANKRYPLHVLINQINLALSEIGPYLVIDTTSLDMVADQTEYTLPADNIELRDVYLQRNDDSDKNEWARLLRWDIIEGDRGSADTLVFALEYPDGYDIRLDYLIPHPVMYAADDVLSDQIYYERVVVAACLGCLRWRKQQVGSGDPTLDDQIGIYEAMKFRQENVNKQPRTNRVRLSDWTI